MFAEAFTIRVLQSSEHAPRVFIRLRHRRLSESSPSSTAFASHALVYRVAAVAAPDLAFRAAVLRRIDANKTQAYPLGKL